MFEAFRRSSAGNLQTEMLVGLDELIDDEIELRDLGDDPLNPPGAYAEKRTNGRGDSGLRSTPWASNW
jgi:hypothetical protein